MAAARALDKCLLRVRSYANRRSAALVALSHAPDASSVNENTQREGIEASLPILPLPKGVYIHGCVGSGKSMLMDMFHGELVSSLASDGNVSFFPTRRVHFNSFMAGIHTAIHTHKQQLLAAHGRDVHINLHPERDVIALVARRMVQEARLLCFDEFQVWHTAVGHRSLVYSTCLAFRSLIVCVHMRAGDGHCGCSDSVQTLQRHVPERIGRRSHFQSSSRGTL